MNINSIIANECIDKRDAVISLTVEADNEKARILRAKLEKLVDVIEVEVSGCEQIKYHSDMLLITRKNGNGRCLSFLIGERIYDCKPVHPGLPETREEFSANWEKFRPLALLMHNAIQTNTIKVPLEFIEIGQAEDVQALVWPGM